MPSSGSPSRTRRRAPTAQATPSGGSRSRSGSQANGDIAPGTTAAFEAYACTNGTLRLTLLVKQPGLIRIALDGREARSRRFAGPTRWEVGIPVRAHTGTCRLTVQGSGLIGAIRLEFDR
jgi:hypothetical protein